LIPADVSRLVLPWNMSVKVEERYQTQQFPPLIDMLGQMVATGMEHARGGSADPSARLPVATNALDLLMHIEDTTNAWVAEWTGARPRNLKRGVVLLYLHAAMRGSELIDYPARWATQIWELHEPPLRVSLRSARCPGCGRSRWGEVDNLLITIRDGELHAECRWQDCGKTWQGAESVKSLGRALGIEFNADALMSGSSVE
jgi:hypothetical protein